MNVYSAQRVPLWSNMILFTLTTRLYKTLLGGGPSSSRIKVRWDTFPQAVKSGLCYEGDSFAALYFLLKGTKYSRRETLSARANAV